MIKIKAIDKEYLHFEKRISIFDTASANFEGGKTHAITGQSGSGKSTLLAIIAGLESYNRGAVFVEREEMGRLSEKQLSKLRHKKIGYVFQQHNLLKELTVLENIMLPTLVTYKKAGSLLKDRALWLTEKLAISHRLGNVVGELSGGEMQRVSLARAVIMAPKIVLADEPTGNLDEKNSEIVFSFLQSYIRINNGTLLMATHSRKLANVCDSEWVIRDQKIIRNQIKTNKSKASENKKILFSKQYSTIKH